MAWPGWTYIDYQKQSTGAIPWNKKFPAIQNHVDKFYLDRWNSLGLSQIKSQELADLIFDYHVNSESIAIKAIQKIVGVTADGGMGPKTIAAINAADPAKTHAALKEERRLFYLAILKKDPTQEDFRDGWLARIAAFPDLVTPTSIGVLGLAVLIGLGIFIYYKKEMLFS
jgi:hypothetical protein